MARIKGWRVESSDGNRRFWRNEKSGTRVSVTPFHWGKEHVGYRVRITESGSDGRLYMVPTVVDNYTNKQAAMKRAHDFMRSNPNG